MEEKTVDGEITLVPYFPCYDTALAWYRDADVCRQVDNKDTLYDLPRLKAMYEYLKNRGDLYYIRYRGELCGDVCLQSNGEINIVIAKTFQNQHIGRRVVSALVRLAAEKGMPELFAVIYDFNVQSQKMFESVGFCRTEPEMYRFALTT